MENHMIKQIFLALVLFASCSRSKQEQKANATDSVSLEIKYAQGFKVSDHGSYKTVEVTYPYQGAQSGYKYLLVQKGEPVPAHDPATPVITIPLESIVCTSTTHIPLLDYLNETDVLVGFPSTDYISSEKMRKRIDDGKVKELGMDKGMNLEVLVTLKPSLVMGYSMNNDMGQLKKIQELGIPIVVNAEYLEKHPLGRAEWIKFMALFFNKEKQADSLFQRIESEYQKTQALAKTVSTKPTVMSGIVYGDTWFLPGGQNYAAKLLDDAGCHYLWREDPSNGFLELSFESVYEKAKDASLWIGVGSFRSLAEIKAAEERYARFAAYRDGNVFTYNARQGAKGGSEFLELGYLRPDLILKDLVKIAHPELLPEYSLYFYGKLK
jgi:iron complex transport system substrate-binding protein